MTPTLATLFAPAERADARQVQAQREKLVADPVVTALLDCFPEPVMIVNRQRQIVLANDRLATLLGRPRDSLSGLRPGEALSCIHSPEDPSGCGTTRFCRNCGAVNALVNTQGSAAPDVQECRLQRAADGRTVALDLRVWASPLTIAGESFTVFALRDTTDEKRRQILERLFFHDLLNTAGALNMLLRLLPELRGEEAVETTQWACRLISELTEEIEAQRDLAAAERGDLTVRSETVDAGDLLQQICASSGRRSLMENKTLVVRESPERVVFESDERLLRRVLRNLIINALEASAPGQTVTVSVLSGSAVSFTVHNESVMSEEVQTQIFQRSFSTKARAGRGIGTYSVKLLTENYLEGAVDFRSSAAEGTTFTVRLPPQLSAAARSALPS